MLVNMSQISTTLAFRHSALPCQTISCTHTYNFSYIVLSEHDKSCYDLQEWVASIRLIVTAAWNN